MVQMEIPRIVKITKFRVEEEAISLAGPSSSSHKDEWVGNVKTLPQSCEEKGGIYPVDLKNFNQYNNCGIDNLSMTKA